MTSQVTQATTASSSGKPISITVSAVFTAPCSAESGAPAQTVSCSPSRVSTGTAAKR
ncbi:hypothetical protein [Streptomyces geysiriensis]|uniref:hypothetical protein n=1 Tax=Streptomyces geysiriensis TaxID=68207 RepID=UPI0035AC0333